MIAGTVVPLFADSSAARTTLGWANWLVLSFYLATMVGIGLYFSRRENTTEDFFLAGRRIPWWAAGISIFGTQLSAITFMAIPAVAFADNWVRMIGNLMILAVIPLVIQFFLPFFRRLNVSTAYEYLERRFHVSVRVMSSTLFMVFQLGRMGAVLYLPAIALSAVTGVDVYGCIVLMGVLATAYTVLGGIEAVIWTDVIQVVVLLGGAILCLIVVAAKVGGFDVVVSVASASNKFHMINLYLTPNAFSLWVMVVGGFFTAIVPYTTDQTVVQRYLTTRDEKQAAKSLWLNFAMTIPAAVIFYGLGTALYVFYHSNPDLARPDQIDQIVPWFVVNELPPGIAGLVIAGIFAAAMSSLDSSMNSVATAFVTDVYRRFNSDVSDHSCLRVAKWLTLLLGVIGTAIASIMATVEIKYLFDFFNGMVGLFGGGMAGVFLLAVFTRRASTRGVILGLIVGTGVTAGVAYTTDISFYLYAAIGCIVCVTIGFAFSFVWPDRGRELAGLTIHDNTS